MPVEQRQAEGNPGHRPLPEPLLVGGRPAVEELAEPPEHLGDEAKEFWRSTIGRLVEVGIVDRVDTPTLEMLATQYGRWRQASRAVASEGLFGVGSMGQVVEHPAVKIERDAHSLFLKTAEHFALTPVARTRLGLAELHRRAMSQELDEALEAPAGVEVSVVDDDDVGLPGA